MKKVIQIRKPNGTIYLYEDYSYWSKERGYSTHNRKCIGKLGADGKPVYNEYYKTRERIKALDDKASEFAQISSTTLEGQRLILEKEAGKTGIRKALEAAFGKGEADRIVALAFYLICRGKTVQSHQSIYDEYFIIKDTPKRGRQISYNDVALKEYLNNDSSYWVLMSTAEKDAAKALECYRERGGVELSFDDMKNLLDLNRLRSHNEHTVRGKVFVNFVALAILSKLRKTVKAIPAKERSYMSESGRTSRPVACRVDRNGDFWAYGYNRPGFSVISKIRAGDTQKHPQHGYGISSEYYSG